MIEIKDNESYFKSVGQEKTVYIPIKVMKTIMDIITPEGEPRHSEMLGNVYEVTDEQIRDMASFVMSEVVDLLVEENYRIEKTKI